MRSSLGRCDACAVALATGSLHLASRSASQRHLPTETPIAGPSDLSDGGSPASGPANSSFCLDRDLGTITRALGGAIPRRISFELQPCGSARTLNSYLWATANPFDAGSSPAPWVDALPEVRSPYGSDRSA